MIALLVGTLLAGTVALRPEASIQGPGIELAEVAEIRGLDAETARRGVRREEVALALRAAGIEAQVAGAHLCRARPKVEIVAGSALEDAARRAAAAAFGGRDVEITVARPAADLAIVAAETRRDLAADIGRRDPQPGAWSVPVDLIVDGARVQTAWVALEVVLYEAQPVAARELRRGEPVDASAWRLERVRVDAAAPRSAVEAHLPGCVATRDVPAGARITELDVRREVLVRAGDLVELEVVRGPIRARSRAVARGQGALGDRVEVQTGESQRRLVGIVVERGLVRVEVAAQSGNAR